MFNCPLKTPDSVVVSRVLEALELSVSPGIVFILCLLNLLWCFQGLPWGFTKSWNTADEARQIRVRPKSDGLQS